MGGLRQFSVKASIAVDSSNNQCIWELLPHTMSSSSVANEDAEERENK